jgi:hypothetical protein
MTGDHPEQRIEAQTQMPARRLGVKVDVIFGIIAPLLCVFFDPAIFRSEGLPGLPGKGLLSQVRLFGYLEIAASTAALGYYLVRRQASPLLAGALMGGSIFALSLGIVMAPISFVGLLLFVGIFGFIPFVTSFVFLRNALQCWRVSARPRLLLATLGMVLILGIPASLQGSAFLLTDRAVLRLRSGSDEEFARVVRLWRPARFVLDPDAIAFAYEKAKDAAERERLARAYREVTGSSVETRLALLND